jgi:hypothetical protein
MVVYQWAGALAFLYSVLRAAWSLTIRCLAAEMQAGAWPDWRQEIFTFLRVSVLLVSEALFLVRLAYGLREWGVLP